jgi:hypothetical protein
MPARTGMKRIVVAGAVSALGMLAFCGTAAASTETDATCTLTAHVSFSAPIKTTPSVGSLSAEAASWTCTGLIGGGSAFSNETDAAIFGTYGNSADGDDSCTTGLEKLTVVEGPFPGGLGLHLTVNRTALALTSSGTGSAGNYGLTLSGSGTFTPDATTACLTSGWASGSIRLVFLVEAAPYPSNAVGGAYTATKPKHKKHKRQKNPNRRGHPKGRGHLNARGHSDARGR